MGGFPSRTIRIAASGSIPLLSVAGVIRRMAAPRPLARAIMLFTLILINGGAIYNRWDEYESDAAAKKYDLKSKAILLKAQIRSTFVALEHAVLRAADEYERILPAAGDGTPIDTREGFRILKGIERDLPYADGLSWFDESGHRIASSLGTELPPLKLAESPQFESHRSGTEQGFVVSPPVPARTSDRTVATVSLPIRRPNGNFAGIVAGRINLTYFDDLFSQLSADSGQTISLIHFDGPIMARGPGRREENGMPLGQRPSFQRLRESEDIITYSAAGAVAGSGNVLVAGGRIPGYPLVLTVSQSWERIRAGWRSETIAFTVLMAAADAAIILLFLFLLRALAGQEKSVTEAILARDAAERSNAANDELLTKLREREAALQISRDQLVAAQKIAGVGSWELDLVTGKLTWSDEIFHMFEINRERFAASYEAFLATIHPDDRAAVDTAYTESIAKRTPYAIVHRLLMADGRIKWVHERGETHFGADGRPLFSRGTVQDITDRVAVEAEVRRSLSEKETLLREVHHRVKNNLQIIASLLYFESAKLSDPSGRLSLEDVRRRLNAMILVHEKLYRSNNLSRVEMVEYVRTLLGEMERSYQDRSGRLTVRIAGEAVELQIGQALPCGMIVAELTTNALKYAFPDGRSGTLAVEISVVGGQVIVAVRDDGIGLPAGFDPERATSFGWRLIRNLVDQIDGTFALSGGPGTAVTISFPHPEAGR